MDVHVCLAKVFESGQLKHFVDGSSAFGNWMKLVNCARHADEQNLATTQVG